MRVCVCVCVYIHTYLITRAVHAQPEAPRLCQKRPIEMKKKHQKNTYINQKRTFVVPHLRQNTSKETNVNPNRPWTETYKKKTAERDLLPIGTHLSKLMYPNICQKKRIFIKRDL